MTHQSRTGAAAPSAPLAHPTHRPECPAPAKLPWAGAGADAAGGPPAADDTEGGPEDNAPGGAALPDAVDAGGCTGGANGAAGPPAPKPALNPREKSDDVAAGPTGGGHRPRARQTSSRRRCQTLRRKPPPLKPLGTLGVDGILTPPRPPLDGLPNGTEGVPLPLAGTIGAGVGGPPPP